MKIIKENWLREFLEDIKDTERIRIISPFITNNMVSHLIDNFTGSSIEIITRFNLNDFKSGVSNLHGLKRLIESDAVIKGVKKLHTKAYIFDDKSAIISSANFTSGGFFNNLELGIKTLKSNQVKQTNEYFEEIWSQTEQTLTLNLISEWQDIIKKSPRIIQPKLLDDYGTSLEKSIIGEKKRYFIKFYGTKDSRAHQDENITDLVAGSHCHFAVTFSNKNGRPRRYQDGDVIFLARMMQGGDYSIFGRAIALKHIDSRDIASEEDIKHIQWKNHYSIYIRIKQPIFLDSTLEHCPKMSQLIYQLKYDSFESTKTRNKNGEEHINPYNTLRQKPDVILSSEGALWLESAFEKAINTQGKLSEAYLNSLYQGF
ncbi:MAG: phospholipase D-like domain-containing protein [Bacteroidota bacterium]|nr:phospholipase D-like domain-containing protein [Bacteroidota bacterium]